MVKGNYCMGAIETNQKNVIKKGGRESKENRKALHHRQTHSLHLAFDFINTVVIQCTQKKKRKKKRESKVCLAKHPVFFLGSYLYQNTEKFASYHVNFFKTFSSFKYAKAVRIPFRCH